MNMYFDNLICFTEGSAFNKNVTRNVYFNYTKHTIYIQLLKQQFFSNRKDI